ncbi:hypothetical protein F7Q95_19540 [Pseudomonas psychrophila]|nr:hypothetical protein F7Q95_19540 [Pseudomonas psychrophila]
MVFSFDRKRGSASVRRWKNWVLSVARPPLPTLAAGLWICGVRLFPNILQICGSGLARDSIIAVFQRQRVVCIASKPAPTGDIGCLSKGLPGQRRATSEPGDRWAFVQGPAAIG